MDAKDILMHIDTPDQVAVAVEAADAARPISAFGLMFVSAYRTPAAGSSFGAGEAHDVNLLGFVGQIVDITPVLPQGHALVVMASAIPVAHAMRVADEERSHLLFDAKVNHLPGRLVPQVAHASLGSSARRVLRPLEFLPPAGMLLAPALLFGKLAELPVALPLERTDAPPGDDECRARVRRDGGQMNLTEVDRRLGRAGGLFCSRDFHADVQFKAVIPDERTGPGVLGQVKRQDNGRSPLSHWQDHTPALHNAHLGMLPAQFAGRLNRTQEGAEDRLHRLAMQGKAPLRGLVQIILVRPGDMPHSGLLVDVHAYVPDLRGFHLRRFQAAEELRREVSQAIHAYCFHTFLFFVSARNAVQGHMGSKTSGVAFIPPPLIIADPVTEQVVLLCATL